MRKLAIASVAFSMAIFLACYCLSTDWPLYLIIGLIPLSIVSLLLKNTSKFFLCARIAVFSLIAGFAVYTLHSHFTTIPAEELDGQTMEITAQALDYPIITESYSRVEAKLNINKTPHLKTLIYDNGDNLCNVKPGDNINATVKIKQANIKYGQEYDYYNSKNIYLIATIDSDEEHPVKIEKGRFNLHTPFSVLRHNIQGTIDKLYSDEIGEFIKSLLLGDKSGLYKNPALNISLSRAGLMHITAVSGMHISFLVSMLIMIFGATKRGSIISIITLWVFVFTTGAAPSALRAGFMQTLLLLAPIFRRQNDSVTSLSLILALILLVNPFAARSVSLQLSFSAMAGIQIFSNRIYKSLLELLHKAEKDKFISYFVGIISNSVGVMILTIPLSAYYFGAVPVLAPIANIASLWAVSLCFCGGLISCIVALVWTPFGSIIAIPTAIISKYIMLVAKLISSVPFSCVYTCNKAIIYWLIITYVIIFISIQSKKNKFFKMIFPATCSAIILCAIILVTKYDYTNGKGTVSAINVGQGQSIAVFDNKNTVMIDCGGINTLDNSGETAGEYLLSRGRRSVDTLILTHLHKDHANGVETLMELVNVKTIIMANNLHDADGLLAGIETAAKNHGTKIMYCENDEIISSGNIVLKLYAPQEIRTKKDANERCLMCKVSVRDYDLLITADSPAKFEDSLVTNKNIGDVDGIIVGHHGSKYSTSEEFLAKVDGRDAIISVGYNTYGHPTYETLERLMKLGYTVYRTDLSGTIEKRVG